MVKKKQAEEQPGAEELGLWKNILERDGGDFVNFIEVTPWNTVLVTRNIVKKTGEDGKGKVVTMSFGEWYQYREKISAVTLTGISQFPERRRLKRKFVFDGKDLTTRSKAGTFYYTKVSSY